MLACGSMLFSSCSLDTVPSDQLSDQIILNNIGMLEALLNGTYCDLRDKAEGYFPAWNVAPKLLSVAYGEDINAAGVQTYGYTQPFKSAGFYEDASYLPTGYASRGMWFVPYAIIYKANSIINSIDGVSGEQTRKDYIKGQALIIRARCYFDLIRFFQHTYSIAKNEPGVPLRLDTSTEPYMERSSVELVYKRITDDLLEAERLLDGYQRPSIMYYDIDVARFLLANVYLTMEDWENAEAYAHKITSKYPLMSLEQYQDGFVTPNEEWIVGYEQDITYYSTGDNMTSFYNFGQVKNTNMNNSMYPCKYFVEEIMKDDPRGLFVKMPSDNSKYCSNKFFDTATQSPYGAVLDMRAGEMYLVEAEAIARQGGGREREALDILNKLQLKRGITSSSPGNLWTTTTNQEELIDAILLERRKELYAEGIDLWDIKRLKKPVIKSTKKGHELNINVPINSNMFTLMIPDEEYQHNKGIVQNPNPSEDPIFFPKSN